MSHNAWVFRSRENAYQLRLEKRSGLEESEIPADYVLIRVRAVSLNYRDIIAWRNLAGRQV
ncbi:MAG: hypothetical protein ABL921_32670, partial [Pirellula sp.]